MVLALRPAQRRTRVAPLGRRLKKIVAWYNEILILFKVSLMEIAVRLGRLDRVLRRVWPAGLHVVLEVDVFCSNGCKLV